MLAIQLPPLMPHAVHLDRPVAAFHHPQQHRRITDPQLHLRQPFNNSVLSQPSRRNLPLSSLRLTPPLEMNVAVDHARVSSQHSNLHLNNKHTPGYGCQHAQQPHGGMTASRQAVSHLNGAAKPFASPVSQQRAAPQANKGSSTSAKNNSAPLSRVPETIRTPQASIALLAAEVTCLFWFEDSSTIDRIEALPSPPPPAAVSPLCSDANPSVAFRKWVSTILSTTQVTQNVILLALMFIWRLKKINTDVKGKPGSEFRLLTVALMLGNKFLDDNTYTNKTWAEVSGIAVTEVHVMEVEFLSNMRYSLFTTKAEWDSWHVLLGKFGTYIDASTRLVSEQAVRQTALHTPTLQIPPLLPSPPTSHHASPPFSHGNSPFNAARTNTPLLLPQLGSAAVSPIGPLPELNLRPTPRKRSYDEQAEEPPPKRLSRVVTQPVFNTTPTGSMQLPNPQPNAQGGRLPLPALTIPTPTNSAPPTQLSGPQLPAPGRAMSMIYPSANQASSLTSSIPPMIPNNLSPYPVSGTSSPISATFGHGHNRSPSYFLQQRSSPYRPVRQPHMLLVPPPSTSQSAPRNVPHSHMQYQPLGRHTERRTGHLPYMHHEAWPQTHQLNQWPIHTPH